MFGGSICLSTCVRMCLSDYLSVCLCVCVRPAYICMCVSDCLSINDPRQARPVGIYLFVRSLGVLSSLGVASPPGVRSD